MDNIIIGDTAAHEGGLEFGFRQRGGASTTRNFKGSQEYIESKELELRAMGYDTTIREGPLWELSATISGDARDGGGGGSIEQETNRWELVRNICEKDILESDSAAVAGMSAHDLRLLRNILDGKIDLDQYLSSDPAFTDVSSGDPVNVFKLIMAGVKSKRIYQPILKHTKTISSQREINWSFSGVGQVYSSSRVIASEAIPPSLHGPITANTSGYITHTSLGNDALYKGWLKMPPDVVDAAGSRVQVVQEWEWGWWAAALYTINA